MSEGCVTNEQLERARAGSEEDLTALIANSRPSLQRFLNSKMGPDVRRFFAVDDLEQEVLSKVGTILSKLKAGAEFEDFRALLLVEARWTLGKARRKLQDQIGESVVSPGLPLGQFNDQPVGDSSPSRGGTVTRADEANWLHGKLRSLEPGLAAVVVGRMAEKTCGEIGKELGIGEDAARKRYLKAATQLRRSD